MSVLDSLADELETRFRDTRLEEASQPAVPWPEDVFDALALRAFELQLEHIPSYRTFCEARGRTASSVGTWRDIPPVPARAFKHLDLAVAEPEAVFQTSGTTRGEDSRGRHLVPRLSLYRGSLLPTFARYVLAGTDPVPFVSLIPSPDGVPDSSLSFMVGTAANAFASETHWLVEPSGTLDERGLRRLAGRSSDTGDPVLLLGTALALLHAVERWEASGALRLAGGSRIMETGGFKGSGREVPPAELYERLEETTGVPTSSVVSEYGMTELLSQLYAPRGPQGAEAVGRYEAPPWLQVRALHPITLDELPDGEPGLLAFFDLANAGSICHVLTEDVGSVEAGWVLLRGRAASAEPRGCSRAMDELMSAARGVS